MNRRFGLALTAFVALGALAWTTLSNDPIQIGDFSISLRAATLCILGLFAVRSVLHFWRARQEKPEPDQENVTGKPGPM